MAAPLTLRMDAAPAERARFVHYAIAALVALCLGFAPATPARADNSIDACFNAIADTAKAGIDAAKSAPGFVENNCERWANPATAELFAAVAGIVTVLEAGGAFKGGDCKDFIKSKIAAALVSALAGAIGSNSPLASLIPDDAKAEIQQLALNIANAQPDQANAAAAQAYDALSNIPGIGQAIDMLPCACVVADAAVKSGSDLAKAGSEGGKCAEFALACAENPLNCAQSLFESGWDAAKNFAKWIWDALGDIWGAIKDAYCATVGKVCNSIPGLGSICGCSGDPPPPAQVDCVGGPGVPGTALGGDVRDLGNGVKVSVSSDTFCSCPPTMTWQQQGSGAWACICPHPGEVLVAYGICQCPVGKGLLEGSCQTCPPPLELKHGACTCPVEGQHFINPLYGSATYICECPDGQATAGNKCAPMCTDPGKTLLADGTCCSSSQVSSCGVCCPGESKPDSKSGSCVIASTPKPGLKSLTPLQSR
jgi:hypothetical protein